jgi:hypothetical protein
VILPEQKMHVYEVRPRKIKRGFPAHENTGAATTKRC